MNILALLRFFRTLDHRHLAQTFTLSWCNDFDAPDVEKRDPEREALSAVNIQAGLMDLIADKNFAAQGDQAAGVSKFTDSLLFGTPAREAGTKNVREGDPEFMMSVFETRPDIKASFDQSKGAGFGGTFDEWWANNRGNYMDVVNLGVDREVTAREATRGLADIMRDAQGSIMDMKEDFVGRELDTVKKFASSAMEALALADPESAALLDQTAASAKQQLADAQGPLSQQTYDALSQPIMSNMAAAGFGSMDPAAQKAIFQRSDQERQRRLLEAQQSALTTVGARNRFYGDPFMATIGRSSSAEAQGMTNTANSQYQDMIDPFNPAILGAFADNVGNQNAANIANANNQAAAAMAPWGFAGQVIGGGLQGAGSAFGGYLAGK
jgi:hypothetical protein